MAWWETITLLCILLFSAEAKFHANHHQKRETAPSLCDPSYNSSMIVQCYCAKDSSETVRSAECYPTKDNINEDDTTWLKFNYLKNATKLVLTNTRGISFKYIPRNALKYTENLIKLDVKYGNINVLEAFSFANLSLIEEIRLSGNQINKLAVQSIAHHKMLNTISLDTNNIVEINRDVFIDLPALEKLYVTYNKITTIHDRAFVHLSNLRELEIDRNKLFSLNSETFSGLTKLLKLDLSGNILEVIGDNTFKPLLNLISLNLDGNKIQMLDAKAFHGLVKLQSLSIAHNEIKELDNVNIFKGLSSLTTLSLKGNRLLELKSAVMAPVIKNFYASTSSLDVEDNNFPCDCRLDWFMALMNRTESSTLKLSLENFKCLPEPALHDKWMKRVESDKMNNPPADNVETGGQADYEYYDETELNGKLFYTDVRDLLNCTKSTNKYDAATLKSPLPVVTEVARGKSKDTKPVHTSTLIPKHDEVLDSITVKTAKLTENGNNLNEVANQMDKGNKPSVYTTTRLATVSAKPLEKKHFDEDMASDEATADRIKAHRSIQEKNDDYNELFNNAACTFVSFKSFIFTIVISARLFIC